jgi:hypothetical protein
VTGVQTCALPILFSSLLNSSVWSEDAETCKVWITLLALADRDGFVFASVSGVARIAALPVEKVEEAIEKFLKPDPRSQDIGRGQDGRRIEPGPNGGWEVLNYVYYRDLTDAELRRGQNRAAKRRERDRQRTSSVVSKRQHSSSSVTPSEASSESESDTGKHPHPKNGGEDGFSEWWKTYPKKIGKGTALEAWKKLTQEERTLALEAAKRFSEAWAGAPEENLRFQVGPAPWLNQKRWTDDPAEWLRMAFRDSPELLKQRKKQAEDAAHAERMARIHKEAEDKS